MTKKEYKIEILLEKLIQEVIFTIVKFRRIMFGKNKFKKMTTTLDIIAWILFGISIVMRTRQ